MSSPEKPLTAPLPRFLALLGLIVMIDLWSSHHLGLGLQNSGTLAPLVATFGAAVTMVSKLYKDRVPRLVQTALDRISPWLLASPVLIGAFLIFALMASTRSSVTVIGASAAEMGEVTLQPLGNPARARMARHGPQLQPANFRHLLTSPLGRTYRVDAPGYLPTTIEVFPLRGHRLTLGRDIPVAPAVLFRPTPRALGSLDNNGRFRVWRRDGGERLGPPLVDTVGSAAFLLGADQPIPREIQADWPLELEGEPALGSVLLRWKRPVVVARGITLDPGTVIESEVLSRAGRPVATAVVTVRNERLIDVPMSEVVQ